MSYSFQLIARDLVLAQPHRQDSKYCSLYYTSCLALTGMRNKSMGRPGRTDPTTHHTMSECSITEIHPTPHDNNERY